jgi:type I restriction enzyme M protein
VKTGDPDPATPESGKVKRAPLSLILPNEAFGYRQITVERPQCDDSGKPVVASKGKNKGEPVADTSLRDTETVPLSEEVETYFEREVKPHVPDAWIDHDKTKIGYEIPFNRHFYVFEPPRPLEEIDRDLKATTDKIKGMLEGLHA